MEQLIIGLLTVIASAVLTTLGMYIGFIQRLRIKTAAMSVEIAQIKEDYQSLKLRVDSHSRKQDEILQAVHDVNISLNEKLNKVAVDIAKINTTLTIIEPSRD